jgi:hypothetical protein
MILSVQGLLEGNKESDVKDGTSRLMFSKIENTQPLYECEFEILHCAPIR